MKSFPAKVKLYLELASQVPHLPRKEGNVVVQEMNDLLDKMTEEERGILRYIQGGRL